VARGSPPAAAWWGTPGALPTAAVATAEAGAADGTTAAAAGGEKGMRGSEPGGDSGVAVASAASATAAAAASSDKAAASGAAPVTPCDETRASGQSQGSGSCGLERRVGCGMGQRVLKESPARDTNELPSPRSPQSGVTPA
jgi:hypothetical protein